MTTRAQSGKQPSKCASVGTQTKPYKDTRIQSLQSMVKLEQMHITHLKTLVEERIKVHGVREGG